MNAPRGLGRGLSSLLQAPALRPANSPAGTLPIAQIRPGRWQPRSHMDVQELVDLSSSIRENGVLQPILVRPVASGEGGSADSVTHEIIAGERRWRASQAAGLTEIPVIIRALTDREALAAALIENIQREELNSLDEARALERLIAEHSLTHEEVAKAVGRSRASVSNLIRLLELPDEVAALVESKHLSMGHARALLGLSDRSAQQRLGHIAADQGLSVRQLEAEVRRLCAPPLEPDRERVSSPRTPPRSSAYGPIKVHERAGRGRLTVEFPDAETRDALIAAIEAILRK